MSDSSPLLSNADAEKITSNPWFAPSNPWFSPIEPSPTAIPELAMGLDLTLAAGPAGPAKGPDPQQIPQTPDDLEELTSSVYDLSTTRAGQLSIPVIGSVGGGTSRRVVVMEWMRFKKILDEAGAEYTYGFTVRFCLTVNKWDANLKVSLPFLSAQAELGNIQASWTMQVRGLVGEAIDKVVVLPQPLSVETFVTAKQSLDNIVAAIRDPSTKFKPGVLLAKTDPGSAESRLRASAVEACALYYLSRGRSAAYAEANLPLKDPSEGDIIRSVYDSFDAGNPADTPSAAAQLAARTILGGIKADG